MNVDKASLAAVRARLADGEELKLQPTAGHGQPQYSNTCMNENSNDLKERQKPIAGSWMLEAHRE